MMYRIEIKIKTHFHRTGLIGSNIESDPKQLVLERSYECGNEHCETRFPSVKLDLMEGKLIARMQNMILRNFRNFEEGYQFEFREIYKRFVFWLNEGCRTRKVLEMDGTVKNMSSNIPQINSHMKKYQKQIMDS